MFLFVVLSTALCVSGIVFWLVRESFRASRARKETPPVVSPVERSSDATAINAMMKQKLPAPPASQPVVLFTENCAKETDALADTLAQVPEKPILIDESKAYLRLEEHDDALESLLARRGLGRGGYQAPPREFSIGVTEKKAGSLEQENGE